MDEDIKRDILAKLMDYGDSVLDSSPQEASVKTRCKGTSITQEDWKLQKKSAKEKKKKQKKTCGFVKSELQRASRKQDSPKKCEEKLEKKMQDSENRTCCPKSGRRKDLDEVKGQKRKAPEVIVFEDPTRRKKDRSARAHKESRESGKGMMGHEDKELEFDKVRHDVWKYGISGFSFADKEKHEADRAIQLGAVPPKRDYLNYKDYMETQKKKKEKEQRQRESDRQMGLKVAKKRTDKIHLRNKGFWTDKTQRRGVYVDGQLGKYSRGVQVITKNDMAKVKGERKYKR
ncbi:uncharacterized protein [Diadema antillarum]|uniref:uncharacterized protein isoform X1 n=1 Tax=Diadema antillarum TaxID=105358 RepID=UPI003A8BC46F